MAGLRDKPRVWVLADETDEGVCVTNAKTDETVFVPKGGSRAVTVESPRTGRKLKKALVPGRHVGSEGRYAVVKFGDEKVPVRPELLVDPDAYPAREPEAADAAAE